MFPRVVLARAGSLPLRMLWRMVQERDRRPFRIDRVIVWSREKPPLRRLLLRIFHRDNPWHILDLLRCEREDDQASPFDQQRI